MANHDHLKNRIRELEAVVYGQICERCNKHGAGFVLFAKDGARDPKAPTAGKKLKELRFKELEDEGFVQMGFIHRRPRIAKDGKMLEPIPMFNSPCCFEQILAAKPVDSDRIFTFRRSKAKTDLTTAMDEFDQRNVAAANLWSKPLPGASKVVAPADVTSAPAVEIEVPRPQDSAVEKSASGFWPFGK